jgi:hypothetical protein
MSAQVTAEASVPEDDDRCAECECDAPRWSTTKRGKRVVHSACCYEHAQLPMFDVPPARRPAKPKPVKRLRNDKGEPLSAFASEVRRQRLERGR